MGKPTRLAVDRFIEKTAPASTGCIEWIAGTNSRGYGTFFPGGGLRPTLAHRWSYEHHVGPIPAGLQIDHLCRNRACVNPTHLEPVTARTNLRRADGVTARNAAKTHCPANHPYAGDNLYICPTTGDRRCRQCRLDRDRIKRQLPAEKV